MVSGGDINLAGIHISKISSSSLFYSDKQAQQHHAHIIKTQNSDTFENVIAEKVNDILKLNL